MVKINKKRIDFVSDLDKMRKVYSRFHKNRNDLRIHYGGGGDFGATFGVKTSQFTWRSVASKFWVGRLILDPGLV